MQTPDNSGYGYIVYTYDIRSAYDLCISIMQYMFHDRILTLVTFQHTFDVCMQSFGIRVVIVAYPDLHSATISIPNNQ